LPTCTATQKGKITTTDITAADHCISEGKIYMVDASNSIKEVTANNDVMAFEMSAAGKFTQVTLNSGSVTSNVYLVLYQCVDGQCLQTDGYIAAKDSTAAAAKFAVSRSDKSLTKSEADASACSSSNHGKLGSSDVLCLKDSKSIAFPSAAGENGYLLKGLNNK